MIIDGAKLMYPDASTCPSEPAEKEAWEHFQSQITNCIQISLDYCASESNLNTPAPTKPHNFSSDFNQRGRDIPH